MPRSASPRICRQQNEDLPSPFSPKTEHRRRRDEPGFEPGERVAADRRAGLNVLADRHPDRRPGRAASERPQTAHLHRGAPIGRRHRQHPPAASHRLSPHPCGSPGGSAPASRAMGHRRTRRSATAPPGQRAAATKGPPQPTSVAESSEPLPDARGDQRCAPTGGSRPAAWSRIRRPAPP